MVARSRPDEAHRIPAMARGDIAAPTTRREWDLSLDLVPGYGQAAGVPALIDTRLSLHVEPMLGRHSPRRKARRECTSSTVPTGAVKGIAGSVNT